MNRLITGIRQGEALTLPCRHCASVSIRFVVEAGLKFMKCPKCGEFTSIQAGLRPEGYEFHSRAVLKGDAGIMA